MLQDKHSAVTSNKHAKPQPHATGKVSHERFSVFGGHCVTGKQTHGLHAATLDINDDIWGSYIYIYLYIYICSRYQHEIDPADARASQTLLANTDLLLAMFACSPAPLHAVTPTTPQLPSLAPPLRVRYRIIAPVLHNALATSQEQVHSMAHTAPCLPSCGAAPPRCTR
jgi:hypothetical protein